MAKIKLSAEHRDSCAHQMIAAFVHEMKADSRIGEKWAGLSVLEQQEVGERMFKVVRPVIDDCERVVMSEDALWDDGKEDT